MSSKTTLNKHFTIIGFTFPSFAIDEISLRALDLSKPFPGWAFSIINFNVSEIPIWVLY